MKTFKLNKPAILMAFNVADLSPAKELEYVRNLTGEPVKQVVGCWHGAQEASYVFTPHSAHAVFCLLQIARKYEQEAIVFLDSYRNGLLIVAKDYEEFFLLYRESRSTHTIAKELGIKVQRWIAVASSKALASEGYTFDPSTQQYYNLV